MVPVRENAKEVNAADIEHIGALASGTLLLLNGFRRGGIAGAVYKIAGLGLIYRGQQGYRRLYQLLGIEMPARPTGVGKQNVRVDSEILVNRPRQELYRIWRNLENLPVFMDHLLSVHEVDDRRSLWVARAPAGMVVKWDAEIVNDVENELIAWQSLEGSGVDNAGSVRFEDAGNGTTRVKIVLRYDPPADMAGFWIAKLFRNDAQAQIDHDLERFKAIMELGSKKSDSGSTGAKRSRKGAETPQAEVL
ncbi:SRPBCC family protein [Fimbriimonas ginsengisoli]|uniref:Cyclase/dehydrase n=1 Tax=Fimbriimonas ginsengisoli Gsoil 348 TaxID=661478 RepID=A0A068NVR6_FIMGI|nr:SRPBCC family protein [Fimbriimonas ginsengisoli]AIE86885.1 cyclase/dehydrase [Fimbriimonas ginsengisoli Gsoil 348]